MGLRIALGRRALKDLHDIQRYLARRLALLQQTKCVHTSGTGSIGSDPAWLVCQQAIPKSGDLALPTTHISTITQSRTTLLRSFTFAIVRGGEVDLRRILIGR